MKPENHRIAVIEKKVEEAPNITSLYFKDDVCLDAKPGQYLMLWLPGVDEVPMSLSSINRKELTSVTIKTVGDATEALNKLNIKDRVGIRGPFGNGFTITGSRPLLVGGGTGIAALTPLAELMMDRGLRPTFVIGSQTMDELIFRDRLRKTLGRQLIEATDDGTCGYHGYASECALTLIDEGFDSLYTCGPELMIAAVFIEAKSRGIPVQSSLERYIKCAVGLCGSCAIGPYRVCKDGPVFDTDMLENVKHELGISRMDPSGRIIPVKH